ncbi:hypothetical protein ABH931_003165 [Streptacidiphilus sp. MAP12-33]
MTQSSQRIESPFEPVRFRMPHPLRLDMPALGDKFVPLGVLDHPPPILDDLVGDVVNHDLPLLDEPRDKGLGLREPRRGRLGNQCSRRRHARPRRGPDCLRLPSSRCRRCRHLRAHLVRRGCDRIGAPAGLRRGMVRMPAVFEIETPGISHLRHPPATAPVHRDQATIPQRVPCGPLPRLHLTGPTRSNTTEQYQLDLIQRIPTMHTQQQTPPPNGSAPFSGNPPRTTSLMPPCPRDPRPASGPATDPSPATRAPP